MDLLGSLSRKASDHHIQNNTAEALGYYDQLFALILSDDSDSSLRYSTSLANYISLLRSSGNNDKAVSVAEKLCNLGPQSPPLYFNYAQALLEANKPALSLFYFNKYLRAEGPSPDILLSVSHALTKLGMHYMSYVLLKRYLPSDPDTSAWPTNVFARYLEVINNCRKNQHETSKHQFDRLSRRVQSDLDSLPLSTLTNLVQIWTQHGDPSSALKALNSAITQISKLKSTQPELHAKPDYIKTIHIICWNLSIACLKKGIFDPGWVLYDHGLLVPAQTSQKWQRSFSRYFSNEHVPAWKAARDQEEGNLLIYGEQGIGDTMMFSTLLPYLNANFPKLGIVFLPGDRLCEIYKRSFGFLQVATKKDLFQMMKAGFVPNFQIPIGSLAKHFVKDPLSIISDRPFLVPDETLVKKFRSRQPIDSSITVGLSWQGGGHKDRIPVKSVSLATLLPLLRLPRIDFLSLQYGDDGPIISKFNQAHGIHIRHDDDVNPLLDMDTWLCQVASCDLVVSVANTTVHGSAALGIETLCLVSSNSDWRWLDKEFGNQSYWYKSVTAFYHGEDGWSEAVSDVIKRVLSVRDEATDEATDSLL